MQILWLIEYPFFFLSFFSLQLSSANPVYEKFYRQVRMFLLRKETFFYIKEYSFAVDFSMASRV